MKALVLVLALSACSPSVNVGGWDNRDPRNCLEPSIDGRWENYVCRPGRGFMIWAVWKV